MLRLILLLIPTLMLPLCKAAPLDSNLAKKIADAVTAERIKDQIPGITYAVFDRAGILLSGASGFGDAAGTQKLDPSQSLFRIASLSKMVTSIAVLQLVQEGVLTLDRPLFDLDLPFIHRLQATHQGQAHWQTLTLRHLLSHTGGISKDVPGTNMWLDVKGIAEGTYPTYAEFDQGLADVELIFAPGQIPTGMKYSNLGFNMLARVVEGMNPEHLAFSKYVDQYVLEPLGMRHSHYQLNISELRKLTVSHTPRGVNPATPNERMELPKVFDPQAYDGSVGIATTVEDMARLGIEAFKWVDFSGNSSTGLDLTRKHDMVELTSPYAPDLGWSMGGTWAYLPGDSGAGPVWFGNEGTGFGERSMLYISPELGYGIVMQFNARDAYREKYAKIIADTLSRNKNVRASTPFNQSTTDLLARVRKFLAATPAPANMPPTPGQATAELRDYLGNYSSTIIGANPVTESVNGKLIFMGFELETVDAKAGRFRVPPLADVYFSGEPVEFVRDADGKVDHIVVGGCQYFYRGE